MYHFQSNVPVTKEYLVEFYRNMFNGLSDASRIAVFLDGSIGAAVGAMIACELVGRGNVLAITCPHLQEQHRAENDAIVSAYCGDHRRIPITMPIADMVNELGNAGISITSMSVIKTFERLVTSMVGTALREEGYLTLPPFQMEWSLDEFVLFATECSIPQIVIDAAVKEVSDK